MLITFIIDIVMLSQITFLRSYNAHFSNEIALLVAFYYGLGRHKGENTEQKERPSNVDLNQELDSNSVPIGQASSCLHHAALHMSPILNKATPNRSSTSKKPEKWLSVSLQGT